MPIIKYCLITNAFWLFKDYISQDDEPINLKKLFFDFTRANLLLLNKSA